MPIDARVPLAALANPQQPIDLIGMARQASALHAEQAQAEQQARKAAGQKAFQLAVQEASGDYDTAADLLDKRGFGDVALSVRSDLAKYREQAFKAQNQRLTSRENELKLFTTLANLITDDTSQQMVIKSLSPELQQQAIQTLGPTYDPNRVKLVQEALLTQKDKSEIQSKAFRDFLEAQKLERGTAEWVQKQTSALGQYLSATNTPREYAEVLENAPALGISPEVARLFVGGSPETAAKIGMSAKDRADLVNAQADNMRADQQLAETRRHNTVAEAIARGNLSVAMGNLGLRKQELNKPSALNMKPPTGAQQRALNFFNRAKQASDEIDTISEEIANLGTAGQYRLKYAPNIMQTQTGQTYDAAQRAFTEARLRKDSGAAIPEQEFENDRRTYFVQPGDSKKTIEQKTRARAAILASLAYESGPALVGFYGDGAPEMLDEYKRISTGRSAPAPTTPPPAGGVKVGRFTVREKP